MGHPEQLSDLDQADPVAHVRPRRCSGYGTRGGRAEIHRPESRSVHQSLRWRAPGMHNVQPAAEVLVEGMWHPAVIFSWAVPRPRGPGWRYPRTRCLIGMSRQPGPTPPTSTRVPPQRSRLFTPMRTVIAC